MQTKKVKCINWRQILSFFMMIAWVGVFKFLPVTPAGQVNQEKIKNLKVLPRDTKMKEDEVPFLMNWMEEGQLYDVDFWLSRHGRNTFFGYKMKKDMKVAPVDSNPPVWSLRNVTYSLDPETKKHHSTEIELALDAIKLIVDKSKTLFLHVRVRIPQPLKRKEMSHPRHQYIVNLYPDFKTNLEDILKFERSIPLM